MKVIIKDTHEVKTLSIIDPKTGVNFIGDFIGNTGAFANGHFKWSAGRNAYVCSQDIFDWWNTVVTDNQAMINRVHDLEIKHGTDKVYSVIYGAGFVDLEDHAANINRALDEAFGK